MPSIAIAPVESVLDGSASCAVRGAALLEAPCGDRRRLLLQAPLRSVRDDDAHRAPLSAEMAGLSARLVRAVRRPPPRRRHATPTRAAADAMSVRSRGCRRSRLATAAVGWVVIHHAQTAPSPCGFTAKAPSAVTLEICCRRSRFEKVFDDERCCRTLLPRRKCPHLPESRQAPCKRFHRRHS